jgi:ABC-type bacteriocin/lantibiotic exporter with double-glycine peptidase domain
MSGKVLTSARIHLLVQNPTIFAGTILESVTSWDPSPDIDRAQSALDLACLSSDVGAMPRGINTHLIDGGFTLSGGQRQRLALARAMYAAPDVLLMDEATSQIDLPTERLLLENLFKTDMTLLLVSHRPSLIERLDNVVVLVGGALESQGSPAELLQGSSEYRRLVGATSSGTSAPAARRARE